MNETLLQLVEQAASVGVIAYANAGGPGVVYPELGLTLFTLITTLIQTHKKMTAVPVAVVPAAS